MRNAYLAIALHVANGCVLKSHSTGIYKLRQICLQADSGWCSQNIIPPNIVSDKQVSYNIWHTDFGLVCLEGYTHILRHTHTHHHHHNHPSTNSFVNIWSNIKAEKAKWIVLKLEIKGDRMGLELFQECTFAYIPIYPICHRKDTRAYTFLAFFISFLVMLGAMFGTTAKIIEGKQK